MPYDTQEVLVQLAGLAKPRMMELLRLISARHVYDPIPGLVGARYTDELGEVTLNGFKRSVQSYQNFERFLRPEKLMGFLVEPCILPIAKAIVTDGRGHRLLVTRKVAPNELDRGEVGHVKGFGMRLLLNVVGEETTLTWECLYGIL